MFIKALQGLTLNCCSLHGILSQSCNSLGQMGFQVFDVMRLFNLLDAFLQLRHIFEYWIKDALSVRHELSDFIAQILLDINMFVICVSDKEIEVAL